MKDQEALLTEQWHKEKELRPQTSDLRPETQRKPTSTASSVNRLRHGFKDRPTASMDSVVLHIFTDKLARILPQRKSWLSTILTGIHWLFLNPSDLCSTARVKPWVCMDTLFYSLGAMALYAHSHVGTQRHGSWERGASPNSQGFTLAVLHKSSGQRRHSEEKQTSSPGEWSGSRESSPHRTPLSIATVHG